MSVTLRCQALCLLCDYRGESDEKELVPWMWDSWTAQFGDCPFKEVALSPLPAKLEMLTGLSVTSRVTSSESLENGVGISSPA